MFRCLFLCALLFPALTALGADPRPKSGISAIDSLPVNDWGSSDSSVSTFKAVALSVVIPGGGQFYSGHPVRGGFLLGLEATLIGLSLTNYFVTVPQYDRETRTYLDSANAEFRQRSGVPQSNFQGWVELARVNGLKRIEQADLANSELAWAIGLHFYGITDALEIAHRSQDTTHHEYSVKRAMWYGLAFPGGGQLYTGNYGKFGMLWMALGASALSAWSRQNVVEALNTTENNAISEGNLSEENELDPDLVDYRKNRNEYYWAMALLYVYGVLDGMVDAALSDFDSPNRYAVGPGSMPLSVAAYVHF